MPVYAGSYLKVDLTAGFHHAVPISDTKVRTWLLGSGLAAKLYYEEMDPGLDPLAPASSLYIFNGVLTGTFAPTGCRSTWCGKSPLTGIWNESNLGNFWGAELRACDYDGLVITGRSETPVYLYINAADDQIELRDATHLWGQDYFETANRLLEETHPKAQIAGIGQAGERLVKIAGVLSGPADLVRTAGRGGMGALMGSKHLKAIVLRGGRIKPEYPDVRGFRDTVKEQNNYIKENSLGMSTYGTSGGLVACEIKGDTAFKNWSLGNWPEVEKISGQTIHDTIKVKHTHCFACPIGCGHQEEATEGAYRSPLGKGLEYETLAGLGGNCQVSDLGALSLANSLCNRYGLDTISTSGVIAFAMEAYEKQLIDTRDTGGVELRFGDPEALLAMIHKIALREDIGRLLGEGVRAAAAAIGHGAADFAVHVKGLEVAYHDPRAFVSMAVNYATAARGGCHLESASYWNGFGLTVPDLGYPEPLPHHESTHEQVRLAYDFQNFASVYNPLGLCKFIIKGKIGPERLAEIVNRALGWEWTTEDILVIGRRVFQLKRLINLRLGVTPADDVLPKRLAEEARPSGDAAGVLPDMDRMLTDYYQLRGWDQDGRPSAACLAELGLAELA